MFGTIPLRSGEKECVLPNINQTGTLTLFSGSATAGDTVMNAGTVNLNNNGNISGATMVNSGNINELAGPSPWLNKKLSCFRGALCTLHNAKVALRSGTERLKRLLVCLAFMSDERSLVAVEFDKYRPQLQPGLVGLNLAGGPG